MSTFRGFLIALLAAFCFVAPGFAAAQTAAPSTLPSTTPSALPSTTPSASPSATPPSDADAIAKVDAFLAGTLRATKVPGISITIARDGATIYSHGYGYANLAWKRSATTQTHYEIGSITKQFTATAILQLKESGKLSLDDTLHRWIPEYARAKSVTIRELLGQTTGIPNYTEVNHFIKIASTRQPSFPAILELIDKKPLEFKPGSKFTYSNTNYILLGEIVERASGVSWEDYIRMHIFSAAGMTQSGFISDESRLQPMATGYEIGKGGVKVAPVLKSGWAWSAGAIVSTVDDMLAWDSALFGGKLINQNDLTAMLAPGKEAFSKTSFYGYGWVIDSVDGHARIWHNGGTFGFLAANAVFPKDHMTVIVLQNAVTIVSPESTATRIFQAFVPSQTITAAAGEDPAITARVRDWLNRFETGNIDRAQLDAKMNSLLTAQAIEDIKTQLGVLGAPQQLVYQGKTSAGGSTIYTYRAVFSATTFNLLFGVNNAGKVSGFFLKP